MLLRHFSSSLAFSFNRLAYETLGTNSTVSVLFTSVPVVSVVMYVASMRSVSLFISEESFIQ